MGRVLRQLMTKSVGTRQQLMTSLMQGCGESSITVTPTFRVPTRLRILRTFVHTEAHGTSSHVLR